MGSPELKPSDIILRAYDEHPSTRLGLYKSFQYSWLEKTMLIDIEVLDV